LPKAKETLLTIREENLEREGGVKVEAEALASLYSTSNMHPKI
jgi:hypothetical protein